MTGLPIKEVRGLVILVAALVDAVEHLLSRAAQDFGEGDSYSDHYAQLIADAKKEVGL